MIYKTIPSEKTVIINCTLEEYGTKIFRDSLVAALRQRAEKIIVEIDNKVVNK